MTNDTAVARVPAIPLILHDPFMNVWSHEDVVTEAWPKHWTGKAQQMSGLARIDGKTYRFLGRQPARSVEAEAMEQIERRVTPLRTVLRFAAGGVDLTLSLTSPMLPDDLELIGRPVSYVDVAVANNDGVAHRVAIYLDFSANWAVGEAETEIVWGRHRAGQAEAIFTGAAKQDPLVRSGDEVQIEWGYLFVSAAPDLATTTVFGDQLSLRKSFVETGEIADRDGTRQVRGIRMPASSDGKVLALSHDFGAVGEKTEWHGLVAYDQVWAVTYFDRRLRPFWSRHGQSAIELIETAWSERASIMQRVEAFDARLVAKLVEAGGEVYARLGALAFRQCLAAHILVEDFGGRLLHFSKEVSSNGSLGTVDVTYPAAPFFLHFNPALLEAQIWPVLDYARSGRWPFKYAPHDVGRYPWANGQNYGGGDRTDLDQMPVEECGNMLILVGALVHCTGDTRLAVDFFPQLQTWADYLVENGLDPDKQLCTDDFAGHMAHNANLAIKATLGLGAFAQVCGRLGKREEQERYERIARDWAARWQEMAKDEHSYRLAFDQPGSWSQKYNLVWDSILGLNLFDRDIASTEMALYRTKLERYGLPLDSRAAYSKLDWIVWTACLTGSREDFDVLMAPLSQWLDDAPAHVPLSDWFQTDTGLQPCNHGFFARSVVGGVFIKLMIDNPAP